MKVILVNPLTGEQKRYHNLKNLYLRLGDETMLFDKFHSFIHGSRMSYKYPTTYESFVRAVHGCEYLVLRDMLGEDSFTEYLFVSVK